jgi:hypothetical protein
VSATSSRRPPKANCAKLTEIEKSYEVTCRAISDLGGQKVTVQQQIAHR